MPQRFRPHITRLVTLAAATTACMLSGGSAALADTCPVSPTGNPFSAWGDANPYFPLPGGSFETADFSASPWSLHNAAITPGSEPFYVNSPGDQQAMTISGGGGAAISQPFCLDATMPTFRFFTQEITPGSDLHVTLVLLNGSDVLGQSNDDMIDLPDGSVSSWAPTAPLNLASALNLGPGDSVQAELVFRVPNRAGSWQIDDVYVDPYRVG